MADATASAEPEGFFEKFQNQLLVGILAGAGLLVSIIFCVLCCVICIRYKRKKKWGERKGGEEGQQLLPIKSEKEIAKEREARNKAREHQEKEEAEASVEVVKEFGEQRKELYLIQERRLPDLGSRLQKHWFRGTSRNSSKILFTEAPLTKHCSINLNKETLDTINSYRGFLFTVRKHPYILPMLEIHYDPRKMKLLTVQLLVTRGSLRDYIFKDDPLLDWSKKYMSHSHPKILPVAQIALFGRQILEAVVFLRSKLGFPSLGHIHTGNIFVTSDQHCRLGGYENSLLNYKTRLYRSIEREDRLKNMDVVMFGHVMYEMGSGCELSSVLPTEEDYEAVRDDEQDEEDKEKVKNIIKFIFEKTEHHQNFKSVMSHEFFSDERVGSIPPIDVPKKVKKLVEEAIKSRPTLQDMSDPLQQEMHESRRTTAINKVSEFLSSSERYDTTSPESGLPDIGRRPWKYWTKVKDRSSNGQKAKNFIVSISDIPETCPIRCTSSTQKTLNDFFTELKHPYLHSPVELQFLGTHVLLVQPLVEKGSLRDRIQATKSLTNWTSKLEVKEKPLASYAALYGSHILEALSFLYQQGFPPLGHVHTGNLYVGVAEGGREVCRLGGYENRLLGYRTYQNAFMYQKYGDAVDLKMFGHVIYELSTGREVVELDTEIEKGVRREVVSVLNNISSLVEKVSNKEITYKEALQKVKSDEFFTEASIEDMQDYSKEVSKAMGQLLDVVRAKRKEGSILKKALTTVSSSLTIKDS